MGEIANTPEAIAKLVAQLKRGRGRLAFCYEAGPCGYTICRQLPELKQDYQVVAPSLIPKKPGERVKTDRRDALVSRVRNSLNYSLPVLRCDGRHVLQRGGNERKTQGGTLVE
ncbi:hypothetical protein BSFA1_74960 (plasmid) [Burkholderia sp. SFA1]|nr:hypothetical protein BSFA1_74960 [Burkholderia sp. SFA1]